MMRRLAFVLLLTAALPLPAADDPALDVRLVPRFGATLPAATQWRDEHDRPVTFGALTQGHPTLLVLAYYHCPMLCPRTLQNLAAILRGSGLEQQGLQVVAASIDPNDTRSVAVAAHQTFQDVAQFPPASVHFLTGPAQASRALADAAGIHYSYDAEHGEYAHPAEYILLDEQGRVMRYLPAFATTRTDLRLALAEVEAGRITSVLDHALLLCYAYDPVSGRYTLAIMALLRAAAIITVLALLLLAWRLRRRDAP
jgi:protein SCO1/2